MYAARMEACGWLHPNPDAELAPQYAFSLRANKILKNRHLCEVFRNILWEHIKGTSGLPCAAMWFKVHDLISLCYCEASYVFPSGKDLYQTGELSKSPSVFLDKEASKKTRYRSCVKGPLKGIKWLRIGRHSEPNRLVIAERQTSFPCWARDLSLVDLCHGYGTLNFY